MTSLRVRLRFRSVVFILFIGVLTVGPLVGGLLGTLADRIVLALTLFSVGRDLNFV